MGRPRRTAAATAILATVAVVALVAIPAAIAAFGARTQNEGDTITAAPDFTPPAITATVVAKNQGGVTGFVHNGGAYFVYANVSPDTGNPASGLATVKANVGELTSGQTGAALAAGSYTAGGVSYGYRSAELTANSVVEGSHPYSVTATDNAGNARTVEGTATVDNLAPKASDVQTANGGTTVGLAEEKDTVTFTFSEPIDPQSILAGWNGTATNVVVRLVDNGLLGLPLANDELFVYNAGNTAALPLGGVNLGRGDYVAGLLGGAIYFGATGTKSTMTMSGSAITVTFGTESAGSLLVGPTTAAGTGSMVWSPEGAPYDRAGNAMSTATATESGAADKEF
ncbi:MAG: hypothetical protein JST08_17990 [Actinobacteria bacterium]|nr:hypothetical protein [Actinomycetota bacterium]